MKKLFILSLAVILLLLTICSSAAFAVDTESTAISGDSTLSENAVTEEDESSSGNADVSVCRSEPVVSLDGKNVMLVGNSMFYYGRFVIHGSAGKEDYGYFYQIAAANGEKVKVIDSVYSSHDLSELYDKLIKMSDEERSKMDYVVMSEANIENNDLLGSCRKIMSLFPEDTKFIYMCNPMMHYNNMESLLKGVEDLRKANIDIVDWGGLVYDVYSGKTPVPGAKFEYDFSSFIIDNVDYSNDKGLTVSGGKADIKHPNPLSGYIEAQMLYTAITNRSALYTDYSFTDDSSLDKKFDIDAFAEKYYTGTKKTNFTDIMRSPADMFGLQRLIDSYLAKEGKHPVYVNPSVEPTCTSAGLSEGYYCSVCCETVKEQEYMENKGGHKPVYVSTVAPTCTKDGKTGSAYCSECSQFLINPATLKATGHSDITTLTTATTERDGLKEVSCTVCNQILSSDKISKISSVKLSQKEYVYDGKDKTPKVTVKTSEGKTLKEGKHYTVTYPEKRSSVGDYKVTVEFKGNYSGKKKLTFKIRTGVSSSLTAKSYVNFVKLTWKKVEGANGYRVYVYNSETKKYEKYADTKRTVINIKNRKSGTKYKFRVKAYTVVGGKTYYSDSYKSITAITKPSEVKLKSIATKDRGEVTVRWKKTGGADGYSIIYAGNKSFKSSVKIAVGSGESTARSVKKLKSGKKYYFKVRAYKSLNGKKVYGPYSAVKNITVK